MIFRKLNLSSMYLINKEEKKLEKINNTTFKELGVSERYDLQEWIAKNPDVLGEELLIIQKEFDGFQDTNERLDLLAIDKQGNLVIIENKLDDSGRDVVWQSLKYSSYCASLNSQQIEDIFNEYLRKENKKENAGELLIDFFGKEDYEETMNIGNSQRIIMISGKFRKEVTSTAMWLLSYGLRLQCFKASIYEHNGDGILNFEQIIPMKDAEDYVIRMANKNLDEIGNKEELKNRHSKRLDFWGQFIVEMNKVSNLCANINPSKDNWISLALGMSGVNLNLVITQNHVRSEVYISTGEKKLNKNIFDYFYGLKEEIEKIFGDSFIWEKLEDKNASRIRYQLDNVNAFNKDDWGKINNFFTDVAVRMEKTFAPYIKEVRKR